MIPNGTAFFPQLLVGTTYTFSNTNLPAGQVVTNGAAVWIGTNVATVADDLCIVKSMVTDAFNHAPAQVFMNTGHTIVGRPSMGSWLTYGLGSENQNLPAFVVLVTPGKTDQPLYSRLWGSGFLPSEYQGVQFRSGKEPVLYLGNPAGVRAVGHVLCFQTATLLGAAGMDRLAAAPRRLLPLESVERTASRSKLATT